MAQQNNMPRTRSTIIFIVIGLVLIGVAAGGVWFAKQRSGQLANNANQPEKVAKNDKPTQENPKPAPSSNSGQNAENNQSNQQNQSQQSGSSNPPQTAANPAPQNVPSTGPSNIPSTGPDDFGLILGAIALGGITYLALRNLQSRNA